MNRRYERWRWITFGITWLIYASFYLTRKSFAVAKVALSFDSRILLHRDDLGLVDSTYLTVYMIGQFVFGPLGDRFGPRKVLLFGLALSVLAAVGSGFSTTLVAFLVCAGIQGIAQSTGWSNTTKAMSSWFSVDERGRVIGWWCTHYTVGAAVALPFAGWAMEHFGRGSTGTVPYWPAAFWAPGAVVAIVFILTWILLRNRPEDVGLPPIDVYHAESSHQSSPEQALVGPSEACEASEGSWQRIFEVLTTPEIWLLAFSYFSIKLVRYAFYFWGPKFVSETVHGDALVSTLIAAVMPLGGLVGVIASGYLSDELFQARRAPVAVISLLLTAAVMLVGLTSPQNVWVLVAFFFLVGVFLFGPDCIISATAAIDFGTKRGTGTAVGIINGVGSIGGILGGWLPGQITTKSNWTHLFMVMLVGLVISAVVLLPLWWTRPSTA